MRRKVMAHKSQFLPEQTSESALEDGKERMQGFSKEKKPKTITNLR